MTLRYAYNTNGAANHRLDDALRLIADAGYAGVALTLFVSAGLIVWLNPSVAPGSFQLANSGEPLLDDPDHEHDQGPLTRHPPARHPPSGGQAFFGDSCSMIALATSCIVRRRSIDAF